MVSDWLVRSAEQAAEMTTTRTKTMMTTMATTISALAMARAASSSYLLLWKELLAPPQITSSHFDRTLLLCAAAPSLFGVGVRSSSGRHMAPSRMLSSFHLERQEREGNGRASFLMWRCRITLASLARVHMAQLPSAARVWNLVCRCLGDNTSAETMESTTRKERNTLRAPIRGMAAVRHGIKNKVVIAM